MIILSEACNYGCWYGGCQGETRADVIDFILEKEADAARAELEALSNDELNARASEHINGDYNIPHVNINPKRQ